MKVAWLESWLTLAAGLVLKRAINWPFDFILYPFMIYRLGPVWGGLVMTLLSIPFNLLTIRGYDWSKTDWLMIERVKSRAMAIQNWFLEEEETDV